MRAYEESELGRVVLATRRRPLLRVSAAPWLAKLLVAAGAHRAPDDTTTSVSDGEDIPTHTKEAAENRRLEPRQRQLQPEPLVGQARTFDEFFRRYYRTVVKCVIYAGATVEEAEEATSNAMIEAYRSWPLLENPDAWVRSVAVNDYVEHIQPTWPHSSVETTATPRGGTGGSGPVTAEDPNESHQVRSALRRLSSAQRKVGALQLSGYEPSKIAETLGKPGNLVLSNLRYADERLRHELSSS